MVLFERAHTRVQTRLILLAVVLCLVPLTNAYPRSTEALRGEFFDRLVKEAANDDQLPFRVETVKIDGGGAEIVTIFYRTNRTFDPAGQEKSEDVPMISVLRDTLGDDKVENDRLRYVWMLTYVEPSFAKKFAAAIPFNYGSSKGPIDIGDRVPPPIIDMKGSGSGIWNTIFWQIIRRGFVGMWPKALYGQYRQNSADYRKAAIASALLMLQLYEKAEGEQVFTAQELRDIQSRLWGTEKTFGGGLQPSNLDRLHNNEVIGKQANRGQTRELLRRFSEAQGLYFDPLELPDGSARHAIVWIAREDLAANKGRTFEKRFLNIANPWTDDRLTDWSGYSEVRWYDAESREVAPETPEAVPRTLIPLAIYGFDHAKIPIILVDFRDVDNPRKRERSRRVLDDLTTNVLSLSKGGGLAYTVGRFLYDFVTGRRGSDTNQPTRIRAYSQLKTLLAIDESLDEKFRLDIERKLQKVPLNPLINDLATEMQLARDQYRNLMNFAHRPDGLRAKLDDERIKEMTLAKHNGKIPFRHSLFRVLTFGKYQYRVKPSAELMAKLDLRRQLDHHERVLRETLYKSVRPEIDSNAEKLRDSLAFVSENGTMANGKVATALAKIFTMTRDYQLQSLCLAGLYKIDQSEAKKALLAIYSNPDTDPRMKDASAQYLKRALAEGQRIDPRDVANITGLP